MVCNLRKVLTDPLNYGTRTLSHCTACRGAPTGDKLPAGKQPREPRRGANRNGGKALTALYWLDHPARLNGIR